MLSHQISGVLDPVSAQDAATKNYVDSGGRAWAAWTPTMTYTAGTPTGVTTTARWTRAGKIVYWNFYTTGTSQNGFYLTIITFTLPVTPANIGMRTACTNWVVTTGASTPNYCYVLGDGADNKGHLEFVGNPSTNSVYTIRASGFYEVT
jgi:hypothetical protein